MAAPSLRSVLMRYEIAATGTSGPVPRGQLMWSLYSASGVPKTAAIFFKSIIPGFRVTIAASSFALFSAVHFTAGSPCTMFAIAIRISDDEDEKLREALRDETE